jgi:hypothetical protein
MKHPGADLLSLKLFRYLQSALKRINSLISGHEFKIIDIYAMQNLCAYEVSYFPTL